MKKVMGFLLLIGPSIIIWPESEAEKQHLANEFEEVIYLSD